MSRLHRLAAAVVFAAVTGAPATGAEAQAPGSAGTGTIEGRVILEPAPPPRRSANRYPGGQAEAHQIQGLPAFVYLVGEVPAAPGGTPTPTMTQRDTAFIPAVVGVRAGGVVAFPNGDPFFHNVFSYSSAQRFDLGRYPQGESKSVTFTEPGIVEVFCEVHEFMRGAVVVTENQFHAIVGADGRFRIGGIPAGEYTIAYWHADHQPLQQRVVVNAGGTASVEVELRR